MSILIFLPGILSAQDVIQSGKKVKDQTVSSEYDRSSMTFYCLNFSENHSSLVQQKFTPIEIPEKFYDNTLDTKILAMSQSREAMTTTVAFAQRLDVNNLLEVLSTNKTGQKLKWPLMRI